MESIKYSIYTVRNLTFPSNTYLIKNKLNNNCLIIDPGLDGDLIVKEIKENNFNPIAILSTHGHFDHIGSVSFLKTKYDIPFYIHEADLKLAKSANFFLKMGNYNFKIDTPTPDYIFKEDFENLSIEDFKIDIYKFPGHSPGSCILKIDNFLFSGDILYKNGLGAGSIPREDKPLLRQSILKIFDIFDDNNFILPGHGAPEYIGLIKNNNTDLKNFIQETYEGRK